MYYKMKARKTNAVQTNAPTLCNVVLMLFNINFMHYSLHICYLIQLIIVECNFTCYALQRTHQNHENQFTTMIYNEISLLNICFQNKTNEITSNTWFNVVSYTTAPLAQYRTPQSVSYTILPQSNLLHHIPSKHYRTQHSTKAISYSTFMVVPDISWFSVI